MNDELPFALGFSSSLTDMVIRGPYSDATEESQAPVRQALKWTALSLAALAACHDPMAPAPGTSPRTWTWA